MHKLIQGQKRTNCANIVVFHWNILIFAGFQQLSCPWIWLKVPGLSPPAAKNAWKINLEWHLRWATFMMVRKEHTEQIWSYFIEIHRLSLRSPGFKSPSCPWISLWWGEMWILSLPIFILGKKVPPVKIGARSGRKHGKSTRLYWVQIPPSKTPFKGVETDFWHGQSSCMVTRTLPTKFGQNPSTNKKTQRRAIFGFWNGGPF